MRSSGREREAEAEERAAEAEERETEAEEREAEAGEREAETVEREAPAVARRGAENAQLDAACLTRSRQCASPALVWVCREPLRRELCVMRLVPVGPLCAGSASLPARTGQKTKTKNKKKTDNNASEATTTDTKNRTTQTDKATTTTVGHQPNRPTNPRTTNNDRKRQQPPPNHLTEPTDNTDMPRTTAGYEGRQTPNTVSTPRNPEQARRRA